MASGANALRVNPQGVEERSWPLVAGSILAVTGLGLFWWQFAQLWSIWTTDSLRSIGMLVIPVSLALAIRSVGFDDFATGGSWWGLILVAAAVVGANVHYYGSPVLAWGRIGSFCCRSGLCSTFMQAA